VVDDFLGMETGLKILNEVRSMYNAGAFHDGQVVTNQMPDAPSLAGRGDKIRGDKIKWVGGSFSPFSAGICFVFAEWFRTYVFEGQAERVPSAHFPGTLRI